MSELLAPRRQVVTVCRRLYERGLIAGPDGNVSVRLDSGLVLVTPAGMSKVDVCDEDLVEVTLDGELASGNGPPSSELAVHLRIYRRRADVRAVVHAHPPHATAFAMVGEGIGPLLPELVWQVGWVPLVPYAMPGTVALAERFDPFLDRHDAFLMANHGAVTVGRTLRDAHQRMESLEHAATILLAARQLGEVQPLAAADVAALMEARRKAMPDDVYPDRPAGGGARSEG